MDRQEEHVNIAYTTKEFYTEVWHFTIIYAQVTAADVALIMIPCDCHFTTAIAKGNRKAGDMQGADPSALSMHQLVMCEADCNRLQQVGLRYGWLQDHPL